MKKICIKCVDGLVLPEEVDCNFEWIPMFRCVNCGALWDDVVLKNQDYVHNDHLFKKTKYSGIGTGTSF